MVSSPDPSHDEDAADKTGSKALSSRKRWRLAEEWWGVFDRIYRMDMIYFFILWIVSILSSLTRWVHPAVVTLAAC